MNKGGDGLGPIHKMVQRIQAEEFRRKLDALTTELSKRSSGRKGEELLTSKEIAPIVGVRHHKTVERWAREKGFPCVRIGRNLRFRPGDVLRWLAQRKE